MPSTPRLDPRPPGTNADGPAAFRRPPDCGGPPPRSGGATSLIPRPIRMNSTPTAIAMAATPKATTEVNSEGLQERGGHRRLTLGILAVQLGIAQAAGCLKGVLVDDHRLAVGTERPVDLIAGQTRGVVGHGDLLIGQGGADHDPGRQSPPMMRSEPSTIDRVAAVLRTVVSFPSIGQADNGAGEAAGVGLTATGQRGLTIAAGTDLLREQRCRGRRGRHRCRIEPGTARRVEAVARSCPGMAPDRAARGHRPG